MLLLKIFDKIKLGLLVFLFSLSLFGANDYPRAEYEYNNFDIEIFDLIRNKLEENDYEYLNTTMYKLFDSAGNDAKEWEYITRIFQNCFSSEDEYFEDNFNKWVEKYPDKILPYLARSKYYITMAWVMRGARFANETSEKQFKGFRYYLGKAEDDMKKVSELEGKNFVWYDMMLTLNMGLSRRAENDKNIEEALEIYPESIYLRLDYLYTIEPKWLGSLEDMNKFIVEEMYDHKDNKNIGIIRAAYFKVYADSLFSRKEYEKALQIYEEALKFGDVDIIYQKISKCHYYLKEYVLALEAIDHPIENNVLRPDYYVWKAKICNKMRRYEEMENNMIIANKIGRYDSYVIEYTNKYLN